jgi:hypothetical protein
MKAVLFWLVCSISHRQEPRKMDHWDQKDRYLNAENKNVPTCFERKRGPNTLYNKENM